MDFFLTRSSFVSHCLLVLHEWAPMYTLQGSSHIHVTKFTVLAFINEMKIIQNYEQDLHLKGKSVEIIFQNAMSSYEDMILVQKSSGAAKRCRSQFSRFHFSGVSSKINKPRVFMLVSLLAPIHIISTLSSK